MKQAGSRRKVAEAAAAAIKLLFRKLNSNLCPLRSDVERSRRFFKGWCPTRSSTMVRVAPKARKTEFEKERGRPLGAGTGRRGRPRATWLPGGHNQEASPWSHRES